mmetsp:Transcript_22745/g.73150  ORF Transcript_22745/g.73150 Transcript_22745/m.73150 type:complete len:340 (+) Transcript_22745:324-1343(+)
MASFVIPSVGLGTARLTEDEVLAAIGAGARHLDCARIYGNEAAVGAAIKKSGVPRAELFVTTKVWNDAHRPALARASVLASLDDLRLDYVDLVLIHWPTSWKPGTLLVPDTVDLAEDTWPALGRLVQEGKIKGLGVSNFDVAQLADFLGKIRPPGAEEPPPHLRCWANQFECHPLCQNTKLVEFCLEAGVTPIAWGPLAKARSAIRHDPRLFTIARMRGWSEFDVALRWNLDRGVVVIPKSSKPANVKANLAAKDLPSLKDHEHDLIAQADTGRRRFPDLIAIWPATAHPLVRFLLAPLIHCLFTCLFALYGHNLDACAIAKRIASQREEKAKKKEATS